MQLFGYFLKCGRSSYLSPFNYIEVVVCCFIFMLVFYFFTFYIYMLKQVRLKLNILICLLIEFHFQMFRSPMNCKMFTRDSFFCEKTTQLVEIIHIFLTLLLTLKELVICLREYLCWSVGNILLG